MTKEKLPSHSKKLFLNKKLSASESLRDLLNSLYKEQKQNQEILQSLSFSLRSFTNITRFLELIPIFITQLIDISGVLLIPFHEDGRIWIEQIHTSSDKVLNEIISKIALFKKGKKNGFAHNNQTLELLDKLIKDHLYQSDVCIRPLKVRGKNRGRIYLFNSKNNFFWNDTNRNNLQVVVDLASVALENNSINQAIRLHENVDRQISIGAEIQSQLLPNRCPVIKGIDLAARCRTAFHVGGDYYDFMPTRPELIGEEREKGRWSLVIGDVMGKGIPAGLLMTMLRGMLRAEVISCLPPDKILHDLNQLALDDLVQSHRFMTLFYSDFDPISMKLRYANAAHNPPILWSFESKKISRLDVPGVLIGLQYDAEFICGEVELNPGDVLLYYTDGVTEALGMGGDRFEEIRLIDNFKQFSSNGFSAKEILDKLFKKLDGFIGPNNHLEDDASMIVLKVNENTNFTS